MNECSPLMTALWIVTAVDFTLAAALVVVAVMFWRVTRR